MYKIVSVTNRGLCKGDFLQRIEDISKAGIPVILREKDMSESAYKMLAAEAMKICPDIILHTFAETAKQLCCKRIHLPMHILRSADISSFEFVGASVHSVKEAAEAQSLGADYVTAGHIFATDCKKGVPPRGLDFLREVCGAVDIPVYAIGGINCENAAEAIRYGADGVCVMSGLMQCENVGKYLSKYY